MGKWKNKLWYIHTINKDPRIKRNNLLIYITTWMNLKNLMLSKRGQAQKCVYFTPQIRQNHADRYQNETTLIWRWYRQRNYLR